MPSVVWALLLLLPARVDAAAEWATRHSISSSNKGQLPVHPRFSGAEMPALYGRVGGSGRFWRPPLPPPPPSKAPAEASTRPASTAPPPTSSAPPPTEMQRDEGSSRRTLQQRKLAGLGSHGLPIARHDPTQILPLYPDEEVETEEAAVAGVSSERSSGRVFPSSSDPNVAYEYDYEYVIERHPLESGRARGKSSTVKTSKTLYSSARRSSKRGGGGGASGDYYPLYTSYDADGAEGDYIEEGYGDPDAAAYSDLAERVRNLPAPTRRARKATTSKPPPASVKTTTEASSSRTSSSLDGDYADLSSAAYPDLSSGPQRGQAKNIKRKRGSAKRGSAIRRKRRKFITERKGKGRRSRKQKMGRRGKGRRGRRPLSRAERLRREQKAILAESSAAVAELTEESERLAKRRAELEAELSATATKQSANIRRKAALEQQRSALLRSLEVQKAAARAARSRAAARSAELNRIHRNIVASTILKLIAALQESVTGQDGGGMGQARGRRRLGASGEGFQWYSAEQSYPGLSSLVTSAFGTNSLSQAYQRSGTGSSLASLLPSSAQGGGSPGLSWAVSSQQRQSLGTANPPGIPTGQGAASLWTQGAQETGRSGGGAFDWDAYFANGGLTWSQLVSQMQTQHADKPNWVQSGRGAIPERTSYASHTGGAAAASSSLQASPQQAYYRSSSATVAPQSFFYHAQYAQPAAPVPAGGGTRQARDGPLPLQPQTSPPKPPTSQPTLTRQLQSELDSLLARVGGGGVSALPSSLPELRYLGSLGRHSRRDAETIAAALASVDPSLSSNDG